MGAIAVVLAADGRAPQDIARRMIAAAPHRGALTHVVTLGRCALAAGHGEGRADAFAAVVGDLAIAFNGVLDNGPELAALLARRGDLAAATPVPPLPELLAAGYRSFGRALPSRLRGVFAGAVSDGRTVTAFRDHIGYRSLFWRADANGFVAAVEAKQVVAGAGIPDRPDLDAVEALFYRDATDDTPCALDGVRRLPKSTVIVAGPEPGRVVTERYWRPEVLLETGRWSRDELQGRFDTLMTQAASRALTGNDAISLSGGIDSPAVAAYAAPAHLARTGRPLTGVTVIFPDHPTVDERQYTIPLAEQLGMPLHQYVQDSNPLGDLARWTALADTPFPGSSLAQYEEDYRRVRALGYDGLLTGEHAEFVFAIRWYTLGHLLTRGRWGAAGRELAQRRARGETPVGLARLVARSLAPDRVMDLRHALTQSRHPTLPDWVDARRASAEADHEPVRERWTRSQLAGFIGPGVALETEEICQEVTGLRVRRPWTDIDLWELFLALPAEQKFPDLRPKGLVRDLLRGRVPDAILDRTDKTVFDAAGLDRIDWATLERYLLDPPHRMTGIDYRRLAEKLRGRSFSTIDLEWAKNLANVHAFLSRW